MSNITITLDTMSSVINGDSTQSICQTHTFRWWICKCRVLFLHQIWQWLHLSQHTHGGKTLTQPIITDSKIQHANSFCVHRKSHFDPTGKQFLQTHQLFFLYSSFDRFGSSTICSKMPQRTSTLWLTRKNWNHKKTEEISLTLHSRKPTIYCRTLNPKSNIWPWPSHQTTQCFIW